MKRFLKKYRLVIILFLVTATALILYLFRGVFIKEPVPTPTPVPFTLQKIFPPQGKQETAFPSTSVVFYFSSPVDTATIETIINPNLNFTFYTQDGGKTLFIQPIPSWKLNTNYKITISLKSLDGQELQSIVHEFFFEKPKGSLLSE